MSRPRSAHRRAFTAFVSGGGEFTMAELARRFSWPLDRTNDMIKRAKASGELVCVRLERLEGAKRPVSVYAQPGQRSAPAVESLHAVMRAWSR